MATLGDLKARIISETLRDDLADDMAAQLTNTIAKSIDVYANERWWFNERLTSVPCVAGSKFVNLPTDFRFLDAAVLRIGATGFTMNLRQPVDIDGRYLAGPNNGQPTELAILLAQLYLWPTPNAAYPVELRYVADVQPALIYTDDTSSNFWTNEGQDLITAQVKKRLYRDYLSTSLQDSRVVNANNQEEDAYTAMRGEHNRRLSVGRMRAGW